MVEDLNGRDVKLDRVARPSPESPNGRSEKPKILGLGYELAALCLQARRSEVDMESDPRLMRTRTNDQAVVSATT
jgi:hypothetical protein